MEVCFVLWWYCTPGTYRVDQNSVRPPNDHEYIFPFNAKCHLFRVFRMFSSIFIPCKGRFAQPPHRAVRVPRSQTPGVRGIFLRR